MPLQNITRKPSVLQGYPLNAVADMTIALDYLKTRGYVGNVTLFNSGGTPSWLLTLQLSSGGPGSVATGVIGDWVVIENDSIATIVPAAKAAALYQLA